MRAEALVGITKSFEKVAAIKISADGSMMGRFANSALNAFGGPTAAAPKAPAPKPAPANVSPGGQTMNQRMGNPFG